MSVWLRSLLSITGHSPLHSSTTEGLTPDGVCCWRNDTHAGEKKGCRPGEISTFTRGLNALFPGCPESGGVWGGLAGRCRPEAQWETLTEELCKGHKSTRWAAKKTNKNKTKLDPEFPWFWEIILQKDKRKEYEKISNQKEIIHNFTVNEVFTDVWRTSFHCSYH